MINTAQLKCLSIFAIFAIIGFGPISPGCLIGMYIVVMRPEWFWVLIGRVYSHPKDTAFVTSEQTRKARITGFLMLLVLFIVDIAPVPVLPVIAFAVILLRPMWFYRSVRRVYGERV